MHLVALVKAILAQLAVGCHSHVGRVHLSLLQR